MKNTTIGLMTALGAFAGFKSSAQATNVLADDATRTEIAVTDTVNAESDSATLVLDEGTLRRNGFVDYFVFEPDTPMKGGYGFSGGPATNGLATGDLNGVVSLHLGHFSEDNLGKVNISLGTSDDGVTLSNFELRGTAPLIIGDPRISLRDEIPVGLGYEYAAGVHGVTIGMGDGVDEAYIGIGPAFTEDGSGIRLEALQNWTGDSHGINRLRVELKGQIDAIDNKAWQPGEPDGGIAVRVATELEYQVGRDINAFLKAQTGFKSSSFLKTPVTGLEIGARMTF